MSFQFAPKALNVVLDTNTLESRERLAFWHDAGSRLYVRHQPHVTRPDSFSVVTQFGSSNAYDVSIVRMSEAVLERSQYHTRIDETERCFLCMVLEGALSFEHGGKIISPAPGEIFVIDTCQPYRLIYDKPSRLLHYTVSREELERRLGNLNRYAGVTTSTGDPIGDIAAEMMCKVAATLDFKGELAEFRALEAAVELITTALRRAADLGGASLSSCKEIVLSRLEHAIARQLNDPGLDAAALAREAGVSIRYANKLLAERGSSLMRYVKDTRLERCARMLEDPSQRQRSITEIALALGFNDMSHFSRAFRERFAMSPRDYRSRPA